MAARAGGEFIICSVNGAANSYCLFPVNVTGIKRKARPLESYRGRLCTKQ